MCEGGLGVVLEGHRKTNHVVSTGEERRGVEDIVDGGGGGGGEGGEGEEEGGGCHSRFEAAVV